MKSPATYTESKEQGEDLLVVKDLKVWFPIKSGIIQRTVGYVKAVDGVNFNIARGETLGLVGESGSGKTTLARGILRLVEPTAGEVYFDGVNVVKARGKELRRIRRRMQIIFQDPYASLDPRQTVNSMLNEAMKIHGITSDKSEAYKRSVTLLRRVGLSEEHLYRFPHEFSGGQRQRYLLPGRFGSSLSSQSTEGPAKGLQLNIPLHLSQPRSCASHERQSRRYVSGEDSGVGR